MFALRGKCHKCRDILDILKPGIVCYDCERYFHGECLDPPLSLFELEKLVHTKKLWYCDKCMARAPHDTTLVRRSLEDKEEVKKKLDMVIEVREVIIKIDQALEQMIDRCEQLGNNAIDHRRENDEIKRRLRLHNEYGHIVPKNLYEWKDQKKRLMISRDKKELLPSKAKKSHHWDGDKRKELDDFVRKKHNIHMKSGYKQKADSIAQPSKTSKAEKAKHAIKTLDVREQTLYGLYSALHQLSNDWRIQLMISLVLLGYTILGAVLFHFVEGTYESAIMDEVSVKRNAVMKDIGKIIRLAKLVEFEEAGVANASRPILEDYYDFLALKIGAYGTHLFSRPVGEMNWSFLGSIFFCTTTYSTIGYGDITPVTTTGKILTIFYALIGIPLFLGLVASIGKTIVRLIKAGMKAFKLLLHRKIKEEEGKERVRSTIVKSIIEMGAKIRDRLNVPVWLVLIIQIIYIAFGACIFLIGEDWNYLESFYFVFISLTTVGFGDFVPKNRVYTMCCVAYVVIGLTLTSVLIHAAVDWLGYKLHFASEKLNEGVDKFVELNPMDEPPTHA